MGVQWGPKRRIVRMEIAKELVRRRGAYGLMRRPERQVTRVRLVLECGHVVTRPYGADARGNDNAYCEWCEEEAINGSVA